MNCEAAETKTKRPHGRMGRSKAGRCKSLWAAMIEQAIKDAAGAGLHKQKKIQADAIAFLSEPRRIGVYLDFLGIDRDFWFSNLPEFSQDWRGMLSRLRTRRRDDA